MDITGQDGSYLTELLLDKGYEVHGIIRWSSSFNTFQIDHLYKDESILNKSLSLHYGDIPDSSNLNRLVEKIQPDDYVMATGETHAVREFVEESFDVLGEEIIWEDEGIDEEKLLMINDWKTPNPLKLTTEHCYLVADFFSTVKL